MVRLTVIGVLMILGLGACQSKQSKVRDTAEKKKDEPKEERQTLTFSAYCFYELDDKHPLKKDSQIIQKWLNEKSVQVLEDSSLRSIFDHRGGGPNWAEWNPNGPLYVAVVIPSQATDSVAVPRLFINGKRYEKNMLKYNSNLTWYRIEQDFWEAEAKAIDSGDIQKMYSPDFLEAVEKDSIEPITDLNYGEILRFEVHHAGDTLTRFFHAAYGE